MNSSRHPRFWTVARLLTITLAVFNASPRSSYAVPGFPIDVTGPPAFSVDALTSPAGPESTRVEILWEVPRESLVFRGEGEECRAIYDVAVIFFKGKRQITGDVWTRRVRSLDFNAAASGAARGRVSFVLRRDTYDVEIALTMKATRRRAVAKAKLPLDQGSAAVELGDLEILRREGENLVPNLRHEVTRPDSGALVRFELFAAQAIPASSRIRWSVFDAERNRAAGGDSTLSESGVAEVLLPLRVDHLDPGSYRLEVEWLDPSGAVQARRRSNLVVRMSIDWLVSNRREAALLLEILGSDDVAGLVKKAEGEGWASIFNLYWQERDPTPGTAENEFQQDVFSRMEAASGAFHEPLRKPGWTTDRGRIFLRYGRPENRVLREGDFNGPPVEIWEYFNPRRTFYFVDDRGIGEFVLSAGQR